MYFPLIVDEALMIEPTETESLQTLEALADALERIAVEAAVDPEAAQAAPRTTPVRPGGRGPGRPDPGAHLRRPPLKGRTTGRPVARPPGRSRGPRTIRSRPGTPRGDRCRLIARFRVDEARPTAAQGLTADWLQMLVFDKTFTVGITGRGTTVFMSAGSREGARSYVATERIEGRTEDGREGAVTVQHGGLEADPDSWFGHIVPGTGTGAFEGWSGAARIVHDDDGPFFHFTVTEDPAP